MEGVVRVGPSGKFHLFVAGRDTSLKSKDPTYFEYHQVKRDIEKLNALNLTSIRIEDIGAVTFTPPAGQALPKPVGAYTVDQKFKWMEQLIKMTIRGSSKGMLITGLGGIGKTYTVLKTLEDMGRTDYMKVRAEAGITEILEEDDDAVIEDKVASLATLGSSGDYVVFKGYASPAAIYRLLYEHKNRIVIFDDCDSILKKDDSLNMLKGALDTYEERWISWNTNASAPDLPPCFKFEGQVIIICNMDMMSIDDAVRTRCFKVDVAMTPQQRVERMRSQLANVMTDVDMAYKLEALKVMEDNLDVAIDVSFRSLMNIIKIRVESEIKDWEDVAIYTLTQW
jgi:hypothetical protein